MGTGILNKEVNILIAANIRKYLEEKGITQEWLAQKIGMSKQAMSATLKGTRRLTADEYVDICVALDLSMDYFKDTQAVA